MSRIIDRRSSLVFVIAVLALVVAMSSTAAYAAVARNSVLSKSIKNGEVKRQDLATGAVDSSKIGDGAVAGADLAAGSVGNGQLANGSVNGAKIADGSVGANDLEEGAVDAQGLGQTVTVFATSAATTDDDGTTNGGTVGSVTATAQCPDGAKVISGGADWVNASFGTVADKNLYIHSSYPSPFGGGWTVRGSVDIGAQGTVQLRVRALCLIGTAS